MLSVRVYLAFSLMRRKNCLISASTASNFGLSTCFRGRILNRTGFLSLVWFKRIASRTSLLSRFLFTALPYLLGARTANWLVSLQSHRHKKESPAIRLPSFKSCPIAFRLLSDALRGNLFLPANLYRQLFAASCSATGQHPTSTFGRHTATEAMIIEHLPIRWLKCSFHLSFTSRHKCLKILQAIIL